MGWGEGKRTMPKDTRTLAINVFKLAHLALNFLHKLPTVTWLLPVWAHLQGERVLTIEYHFVWQVSPSF